MTSFFHQFLEPDIEDLKEETGFSLMKEIFALELDEFESSSDVLFRKYDIDEHYDKIAKKFDCKKMPWRVSDLPKKLEEGIAKKKDRIRFPYSEYMKMRRNVVKPNNWFIATWNYRHGEYAVGAVGRGYEGETFDIVERDLRKTIQRVVDAYNTEPDPEVHGGWDADPIGPNDLKFEALPQPKDFKWGMSSSRLIGLVLTRGAERFEPEVLIIETRDPTHETTMDDLDAAEDARAAEHQAYGYY